MKLDRAPYPRMTKVLSILLSMAFTIGSVHASVADTPPVTPGTQGAINDQVTDALVRRVADRTMQMPLEDWDWDTGVAVYGLLKAWQTTGDQRYFNFVQTWIDGFIDDAVPSLTHLNQATPGIATLILYEETGQEKYLNAAQQIAAYLRETAPRAADGALYHYQDQLWVDTLFMTVPFLSRLGQIADDQRYTDEAVRQFLLHAQHLQDPGTGLFFHGWDESEDGHISAAFWGRGNGWAAAAGAELLDQLPTGHPARPEIQGILARQAQGLVSVQHHSGLWHTVVDQRGFYRETSGTAAIGYALFRGLESAWLNAATFNMPALNSRYSVESKVDQEGKVLDVSAGTGIAPSLEDYNGISHNAIQAWGQGLALLLFSQRPYGFRLTATPSVALLGTRPYANAVSTLAATGPYGPLPTPDVAVVNAPDFITWTLSSNVRANVPSAQLRLTTTESVSPGSYPLTVSARTEELTHTEQMALKVVDPVYRGFLAPAFKLPPRTFYPNKPLAEKIWQAVERFLAAHPPETIYPRYTPEAGGPSAANARANIEAACHDFPDLPALFGEGAHHRACYEWVAANLSLFHAARGWRTRSSEDIAWAQQYLEADLDYLAEFVYGPEDSPGESYRDTLAAIWQNPLRAVNVTITADLLRKKNALGSMRQARLEEILSGITRAWHAEFWETEQHPNPGIPFTTLTASEIQAYSLQGRQVASTEPWTFRWNADEGNTSAEETAWMGAGIMLASRVLSDRMPDADEIYAAGRHYVDFSVTYNRPDPLHGDTIRTLNGETEGGAYGERRYWIENHAADMPSVPYVGFTWQFMTTALFASDRGEQQPWPSLVPHETQWEVLLRSVGETLRAADGTFLIDFTPGRGVGFNVGAFPSWWMQCAQGEVGKQYVRYDGRAGGPSLFVSEIGHPAGLDLLPAGWSLMRIAAQRGDHESYKVWENRLNKVLDEYIATPPNPHWAVCKTAPYVSDNPGYHWSRMLSVYVGAYLGASGYGVDVWSD